jgi:hypothetical protein
VVPPLGLFAVDPDVTKMLVVVAVQSSTLVTLLAWEVNFRQRVNVTRKGILGEGRLAVICFTPKTSKPHSCEPREIFSVEVLVVRCPVTALTS